MEIIAIVMVVGVLAYLASRATSASRRDRDAFCEVWRAVAAKHGGAFTPGRDRTLGRDVIEVTRMDVRCTISCYELTDLDGDGTTIYTSAQETARAPLKGQATAYPAGALSRFAQKLGAQDITLGDEVFDRRFVVKASDDEVARAVLDAPTRRAILAIPRSVTLSYRAGVVELRWEAEEREAQVLDAARDLVARVCR